MFNSIKAIALLIVLGIVVIIFLKTTFKTLQGSTLKSQKFLSKLNWWKLIFETYLISFVFYISIRTCGMFGVDLSEILKHMKTLVLFEISIFIILPLVVIIFSVTIPSTILNFLPYSPETKKYLKLVSYFFANKFYLLIVLANILIKFS